MSPGNTFLLIRTKMASIDKQLNDILGDKVKTFFSPVSVVVTFSSYEAGFMRLVSFIYILFHEDSSKINIQFITDKIQSYKGSTLGIDTFKKLIHTFRTVLQHNMNPQNKEDQNKEFLFEDWLNTTVGKHQDLKSSEWKICCDRLLNQFRDILEYFEDVLNDIKVQDEEIKKIIVEDWLNKLTNEYPIYRYKEIIQEVITRFSFTTLDINRFAQKFYQKWINEISMQQCYDFKDYATRQVERDFVIDFNEKNLPLPIDGSDIMNYFNIPGGIVLKTLLTQAREIYAKNPCSKEELLKAIKID